MTDKEWLDKNKECLDGYMTRGAEESQRSLRKQLPFFIGFLAAMWFVHNRGEPFELS